MKNLLLLCTLLFALGFISSWESEEPVSREIATTKVMPRQKIMVIDTGLILSKDIKPYLCQSGHKSFIYGQKALTDPHGHGTNVARLIMKGMDPKKHCLVIVKYWKKNLRNPMELVRASLRYAIMLKPDYVNMSLGGDSPDHLEMVYILKLLKNGTKIAVAAGNEKNNLDRLCNYFPACYKINSSNFRVVGSTTGTYSNKGSRITHWEDGTKKGYRGFSGTSQATAISMSKWIQE